MTNAPSDGSYEIDCHAVASDLREAMTNSEHIPNGQEVPHFDRTRCATEGCGKVATQYFERGGVGSFHCDECLNQIVALTRRSSAGVKGLETAIAQAYVRGVEWRDENPGHVDFAYRFKAAGDYADKTVAALTPSPTLEPTDAEVVAIATLYGNYIPGHGWTGFGPTPDKISATLIASRQSTSGEGV